MKKVAGFSLIELVIFFVVIGILSTAILLPFKTILGKIYVTHSQASAIQIANRCMEWYLGQRRFAGFNNSSLACPCPNTTTPIFCSAPPGFNITTNVSNTVITGDANSSAYKKITIRISGPENTTVTSLVADY